jgi:hypothetical protein
VSTARWNLKDARQKSRLKQQANQRWLSASTIRQQNGEVSYITIGSVILRVYDLVEGSVLKGAEDAGSDYGRYGREADDMTTGDLAKSIMREGGAEAGTEVIVSRSYKRKRNAKRRFTRSQRSS